MPCTPARIVFPSARHAGVPLDVGVASLFFMDQLAANQTLAADAILARGQPAGDGANLLWTSVATVYRS